MYSYIKTEWSRLRAWAHQSMFRKPLNNMKVIRKHSISNNLHKIPYFSLKQTHFNRGWSAASIWPCRQTFNNCFSPSWNVASRTPPRNSNSCQKPWHQLPSLFFLSNTKAHSQSHSGGFTGCDEAALLGCSSVMPLLPLRTPLGQGLYINQLYC